MKIGLDFDGVITDCGLLKSEGAKKLFGISIPAEKFKKEIVLGEGLLTIDQYRAIQKFIYNNLELGLKMKAVEGLFEGILQLKQKHDLQIITSRYGDSLMVAKAWLDRNKIYIPITGAGRGVSKSNSANGCDIFIDDDLEKLTELQNVVPKLFLFSWPYNSHELLPDYVEKVNGWSQFVKLVESM